MNSWVPGRAVSCRPLGSTTVALVPGGTVTRRRSSSPSSPALAEDIARLDVYGRSAAYRGPVRIIHGDKDDVAPLEYARRYLEHYDGNAELEVVPGADHAWATVPHRTRLHQSTLDFFRRELA